MVKRIAQDPSRDVEMSAFEEPKSTVQEVVEALIQRIPLVDLRLIAADNAS